MSCFGRDDSGSQAEEWRKTARIGFCDSAVQLGVTLYALSCTEEAAREWEPVLAEHPEREDTRMYLRMIGRYQPAQFHGWLCAAPRRRGPSWLVRFFDLPERLEVRAEARSQPRG